MNLTITVAQSGPILQAKSWKAFIKSKNVMWFNFWALFFKLYIYDVGSFFII